MALLEVFLQQRNRNKCLFFVTVWHETSGLCELFEEGEGFVGLEEEAGELLA